MRQWPAARARLPSLPDNTHGSVNPFQPHHPSHQFGATPHLAFQAAHAVRLRVDYPFPGAAKHGKTHVIRTSGECVSFRHQDSAAGHFRRLIASVSVSCFQVESAAVQFFGAVCRTQVTRFAHPSYLIGAIMTEQHSLRRCRYVTDCAGARLYVYARSLATVLRVDGEVDASNAERVTQEIRRFARLQSPLIL